MPSQLQSALQLLLFNNYGSIVIVTAVAYDYILTFPNEVEYIWCRPWTWVSTMFLFVRYIGLLWVMNCALGGSAFIPGPVKVSTASALAQSWTLPVFLAAADVVMILRVYAMWDRSKSILWTLMFINVAQVVIDIYFGVVYYNPNTHFSVSVVRLLNLSFCDISLVGIPSMLYMYSDVPRFVLGAALLVLAVLQTVKQSLQMFKATKQWQSNKYLQMLARDGIIYFVVNTFNNTMAIIQVQNSVPTSDAMLTLVSVCYIAMVSTMPRFIIGVRELYEQDLRGRWKGIDTGFGVLSQPAVGQNTVLSVVVFADAIPRQEVHDADRLERVGLEAGQEGVQSWGDQTRLNSLNGDLSVDVPC